MSSVPKRVGSQKGGFVKELRWIGRPRRRSVFRPGTDVAKTRAIPLPLVPSSGKRDRAGGREEAACAISAAAQNVNRNASWILRESRAAVTWPNAALVCFPVVSKVAVVFTVDTSIAFSAL